MSTIAICCKMVHDSFGVSFHRCSRKGVVHEDGKLWCRQHSPSAEQARLDKAHQAYMNRAPSASERTIDNLRWSLTTALAERDDALWTLERVNGRAQWAEQYKHHIPEVWGALSDIRAWCVKALNKSSNAS